MSAAQSGQPGSSSLQAGSSTIDDASSEELEDKLEAEDKLEVMDDELAEVLVLPMMDFIMASKSVELEDFCLSVSFLDSKIEEDEELDEMFVLESKREEDEMLEESDDFSSITSTLGSSTEDVEFSVSLTVALTTSVVASVTFV